MSAIFTDINAPFALVVEHVTQAEFDAQGLTDWLTDEEHMRYEELKRNAVAKRRRQWLLGRYAAKTACRRWLREQAGTDVGWKDILVGNHAEGMPLLRIKGLEEPPTLSIAHSGDEAVAAIADHYNPVGVDIETRTPRNGLHLLAQRVSNENEYQRWFSDLDGSGVAEQFLRLWLAKEATAKCEGKGLRWQPQVLDVIELDNTGATVSFENAVYSVRYLSTSEICATALAWKSS